ncbi:hypothetical protein S101441_00232 [Bacillus subtilis subsp. subtilis]|nr:hypothetical protein S101441_00232 [Bacillus subtilis subsp. subtilis]
MLKLVVSGKEVSVIEDERKDKAISTFLYFVDSPEKKLSTYTLVLTSLIKNNGVWQ